MKKLSLRILFLGLIFFILDKPIGYLISESVMKRQRDQRIMHLMEGEMRAPLLILGSSRAVNGIQPEILEDHTGMEAYNMGYSGSNLNFHKSIFEIILSQYRPERIILVLDEHTTFVPSPKMIYRKDRLYPYLQYKPVLLELCENSSKHYYASVLSWSYRENQNLFPALSYYKSGVEEEDFTNAVNQKGAIMVPSGVDYFPTKNWNKRDVVYDSKKESEALLSSLNYIMEKCLEREIKLTLIRPPLYKARAIGFSDRIRKLIPEGIDYFDLSDQVRERELFFDNGHLNSIGARHFSKLIGKRLSDGF